MLLASMTVCAVSSDKRDHSNSKPSKLLNVLPTVTTQKKNSIKNRINKIHICKVLSSGKVLTNKKMSVSW